MATTYALALRIQRNGIEVCTPLPPHLAYIPLPTEPRLTARGGYAFTY